MTKKREHPPLEEIRQKVGISPEVARHLVEPPISQNVFYGMIERGDVPSLRVGGKDGKGGRIIIPTAPFLAMWGLELMDSSRNDAQNEPGIVLPITVNDASAAARQAGSAPVNTAERARGNGHPARARCDRQKGRDGTDGG
jgi:hypothetical protein